LISEASRSVNEKIGWITDFTNSVLQPTVNFRYGETTIPDYACHNWRLVSGSKCCSWNYLLII